MRVRLSLFSICLVITCICLLKIDIALGCMFCNEDATITAPAPGATVRGEAVLENGTATDGGNGHGLYDLYACLTQTGKTPSVRYLYWSGGPHTVSWSTSSSKFDTRPFNNGAASFKACAFCDTRPHTNDSGSDTNSVTIDNHYLVNVARNDAVNFKYYTTAGGWAALSGSYDCLTTGTQSQHAHTGGHTGDVHTYCVNCDTPPFTAASDFSLPTLNGEYYNGDATLDSYSQNPGAYNRTQWTGEGGDNNYYFTDATSGNVVGRRFVNRPDRTAPCGCQRTGIHFHAGRATNDFATALVPHQTLDNTHGCVRMHNDDLGTLITSYIDVYQPRVQNNHIHIYVP